MRRGLLPKELELSLAWVTQPRPVLPACPACCWVLAAVPSLCYLASATFLPSAGLALPPQPVLHISILGHTSPGASGKQACSVACGCSGWHRKQVPSSSEGLWWLPGSCTLWCRQPLLKAEGASCCIHSAVEGGLGGKGHTRHWQLLVPRENRNYLDPFKTSRT
jgi:hypothetical protein